MFHLPDDVSSRWASPGCFLQHRPAKVFDGFLPFRGAPDVSRGEDQSVRVGEHHRSFHFRVKGRVAHLEKKHAQGIHICFLVVPAKIQGIRVFLYRPKNVSHNAEHACELGGREGMVLFHINDVYFCKCTMPFLLLIQMVGGYSYIKIEDGFTTMPPTNPICHLHATKRRSQQNEKFYTYEGTYLQR